MNGLVLYGLVFFANNRGFLDEFNYGAGAQAQENPDAETEA